MNRVEGVVQRYAWGDIEFIPKLLGVEPDGRPWAELWLGTHHDGPTTLSDGRLLSDVAGELPYLLKVLAAAEPLSLQTHPNRDHAIAGFERGLLPDRHPKPELLCALTPFQALCGVRPVDATLQLLDDLGVTELAHILAADGPRAAIEGLYRGQIDAQEVVDACSSSDRIEADWVRKLAVQYPGDASVAVTVLLNLVVLEPGQALRLDAGNLHAYLHGAGIELMGPSNNVVRGGLTVKHVDIDHLLDVVDTTPLIEPVLAGSVRYELPAAGVALLHLEPNTVRTAEGHELGIDLAGSTFYVAPGETFVAAAHTYLVVPI